MKRATRENRFFKRLISLFIATSAIFILSGMIVEFIFAAGITVDSLDDTASSGNGECTLREAIANANTDTDTSGSDCAPGSGSDVIGFAPQLAGQTITLGGTELVISSSVTLNGPGADLLAISGDNASRVFSVTTGIVQISGLTIRDGRVSTANGGGVYNSATLILDHVAVVSNTIAAGNITDGGGIFNRGTLTVTHSAVISNTNLGSNGRGGGIGNTGSGTAFLINSTVSSNRATSWGGGIFNTDSGLLTGVQSTIAHNIAITYTGGGVYNMGGPTTFKNTLLADNIDSSGDNDCDYLTALPQFAPVSLGYNLVEKVGNCTSIFTAAGDQTNKAPLIGPLADNGGETLTHALLEGSPANEKIPAGVNGCGDTFTTDQRDFLRLSDRACSIGAEEYNGIWLTLQKLADDDTPDPNQTITYTLVAALAPSGNVSVTNLVVADTLLPPGINFLGPVSAQGGSGGSVGALPVPASGYALTGGNALTVTIPVTVSIGIKGGTVITNTAAVSSAEVLVPVSASRVVTVNNVSPVAVGDTPTVLEDSGITTLTVKSNDYDLNWDDFTLTAIGATDNGGAASANGQQINYAPMGDFFGTEVFTYSVADAEFTDTAVVTVTVAAVNDAPSFSKGGDQWLLQNAGAQTVTGWATTFSTGPANESSQTLSFSLTTPAPDLFAVQPVIDSGGELTFAPNPATAGTAIVTATLRDDGGTANGGVDSFAQPFTVTVVAGDELRAIDGSTGGTLVYVNAEAGVSTTVQIPAGAVTGTVRLVYDERASAEHGPPGGFNFAGRIFALEIYEGTDLQPDYRFKTPITLTFTYDPDPASLNYADEATLELRYWNGSAWDDSGISINHDIPNHRITAVVTHLSEFALVGNAAVVGIEKRVAARSETPLPGSVVTYTLAVSNSGVFTATGVVITDALPAGMSFGAWVEQGGATFNDSDGSVRWGPGIIQPFTPITIAFTARIASSPVYSNVTITNTVEFASDNGGSGVDDAGFTTSVVFPVYLPLVLK